MTVKVLQTILDDLPEDAKVLLLMSNGAYREPHVSVAFVVQDTPYQWSRAKPGHTDPLVRAMVLS